MTGPAPVLAGVLAFGGSVRAARARRALFACLVAGTTLIGSGLMLDIVRDAGITTLELLILGLFLTTFAWIAIAFWNAIIGFLIMVRRRDRASVADEAHVAAGPPAVMTRTALVMPIHNENAARVTGGLAAMIQALTRTGQGAAFAVHLLSDTTDEATARDEQAAWDTLQRRLEDDSVALYYRRRPANVGRKAGNIAEFCRQWGRRYDAMIVLDADSLMTASAILALVRLLESHPEVGLIQTVPLPVRQTTLFGRLLQFAACLYSPMLAAGQEFWQADTANYWGHNAIVRSAAFAAYCQLPVLPGEPPLGGAVLSHDFVEAALVRRAGWEVRLVPDLGGSFEEVPSNIPDYARRDRRWCQGSLQHLRLLTMPGLHLLSRLHFLLGAVSYLSSVLWLLLLLAGTAYVVIPELSAHPLIANALGPSHRIVRGALLLMLTATLLVVPKVLGVTLGIVHGPERFGGVGRLLASAILEAGFSVLIAPLMMLLHTRFVGSVLVGREVAWSAQHRDGRAVSWSEAWRTTWGITAVGIAWSVLMLAVSPAFFLWLTPIVLGLLLAMPIIRWSSIRAVGHWCRRAGLFLVPSETAPPRVLEHPDLDNDDGNRAAGHTVDVTRPVTAP